MTGLAAVCSAHRPSVAQQRCQSPGFAELQREGQEHPHPTRQLHGRMKNGTKITQRFATSRTDIVPGYGSAGKPQFDRAILRYRVRRATGRPGNNPACFDSDSVLLNLLSACISGSQAS